jgi:hypothetical protein
MIQSGYLETDEIEASAGLFQTGLMIQSVSLTKDEIVRWHTVI